MSEKKEGPTILKVVVSAAIVNVTPVTVTSLADSWLIGMVCGMASAITMAAFLTWVGEWYRGNDDE